METIQFYKYQGTGNDFVMIDNRTGFFPKKDVELIRSLCDRRFGIGGDGLILLEEEETADFKMVYYNSDGNESTMCGNGGRCIVAFAHDLGVIGNGTTFLAVDGMHHARIEKEKIALQMIDVPKLSVSDNGESVFLFTGSPHHVKLVDDVKEYNVYKEGRSIRYSDHYAPAGTNVNFVEQLSEGHFRVRTYERGVEDETLSCGTGVTAVAIAMNVTGRTDAHHIVIEVEGGSLMVTFDEDEDRFYNVMLIGPAKQVFKGETTV